MCMCMYKSLLDICAKKLISETATRGVLQKQVIFKISQNSQGNKYLCQNLFFHMKLQD